MNIPRRLVLPALAALVLITFCPPLVAQVSLTAPGTPYTQDFVSLAASGTNVAWADNTTMLGWYAAQTNGTLSTYRAGNGGSSTPGLYSFGSSASTERALGSLASNTPGSFLYGVRFVNDTGGPIPSITIGYTGEQWRDGGNTTQQRLEFQYQVAAPGAITGINTPSTGWVDFDALDFPGPVFTSTALALDGNAAANKTVFPATSLVFATPVAVGQEIWIRWLDVNDTGNDHGLAIDDLMVTPAGTSLSIADVTHFEGNAGTTSYDFVVHLTAPALPGGVTFDIATTEGTATLADNDYVGNSQAGIVILEGSQDYTFSVTVNGDTTTEGDEAFLVNVTNVSGTLVSVTDDQAIGTIRNDDGIPDLSVDDVSVTEGNTGTKTATFTVSLSFPAPLAVTFDFTTSDGTATVVDGDYVASSLSAQTIPVGSQAYTFDVTVNGDVEFEPDETFSVLVSSVVGANVVKATGTGTILNDDLATTLIHDIQGSADSPNLLGTSVAIRGVVVGSFQGAGGLGGFFVEEETTDQDADPLTSEGIFVQSTAVPVNVGDLVNVTGTVANTYGLTRLSPVADVTAMGAGTMPSAAGITLPLAALPATSLEPYEGMLVTFPQTLSVTEVYDLGVYGEVLLSAPDRLESPTNSVDPNDDPASGTTYTGSTNVAAVLARQDLNDRSRITLDDGRNVSNPDPLPYVSGGNTLRLGDTSAGITGVLSFDFGLFLIQPTSPVTFTAANPRPEAPAAVGGELRLASFNVDNYFLTLGGLGATSSAELARQKEKLVAALAGLDADVVVLLGLEKAGGNAAAADLAAALTGYAALPDLPVLVGTEPDVKNGMIYRIANVTPVGAPMTDLLAAAGTYTRDPLTQVFQGPSGKFAVVTAHLETKGCTGATGLDADQGDGQDCFNDRRRNQVLRTIDFVNASVLPLAPAVIVMGDFFSRSQEDPIDAIRAAGYVDVLGTAPPNDRSSAYGGESDRLDHAFANAAMAGFVTGATVWHVNGDESRRMDYNLEFRPAVDPYYSPGPYRSSDHDPVLVGVSGTVPAELTSFTAE